MHRRLATRLGFGERRALPEQILITGFGPYPEVPRNPALELVEALGGAPDLATAVLPVEYDTVDAALRRAIADYEPAAVLLTGLRPSGECVNLERVALNLDDAAKPDNAGVLRDGQPIDPSGPPAFISELPLGNFCEPFRAARVPATVSNHAGAYICNRVYYHSRMLAGRSREPFPSLFLHLPWVGKDGVTNEDGEPLTTEMLVPPVLELARMLLGIAAATTHSATD